MMLSLRSFDKSGTDGYKYLAPDGAQAFNQDSLNRYQVSQRAKALVTKTAHHDEVFGAAKRAIFFAVLDDARGEGTANAGQLLKLFGRRGVDIDSRWGRVFRKASVLCGGPGRRLIR